MKLYFVAIFLVSTQIGPVWLRELFFTVIARVHSPHPRGGCSATRSSKQTDVFFDQTQTQT